MPSEYDECWEELCHSVALGIIQMSDGKQDFIVLISILIAYMEF